MQILRLYDRARRPASWTEIIRRDQFAAFAKDLETGASCDPEGEPFADVDAAACAVFDSIAEARAYCEAAVLANDRLHFDIFDADGRATPPLLTILHPRRAATQESDPRVLRRRRAIAWTLIVIAVPVLLFGYYGLEDGGHQIFAGFIGLNALVAASRLLWFNLGVREAERIRKARLDSINSQR